MRLPMDRTTSRRISRLTTHYPSNSTAVASASLSAHQARTLMSGQVRMRRLQVRSLIPTHPVCIISISSSKGTNTTVQRCSLHRLGVTILRGQISRLLLLTGKLRIPMARARCSRRCSLHLRKCRLHLRMNMRRGGTRDRWGSPAAKPS
jgi:hypothetical protein